MEEGLLDPKRTIQIGIRGPVSSSKMMSHEWGMTVIYMEDFYDKGPKEVAELARQVRVGSKCRLRMASTDAVVVI